MKKTWRAILLALCALSGVVNAQTYSSDKTPNDSTYQGAETQKKTNTGRSEDLGRTNTARTLGNQDASTQSDSVRDIATIGSESQTLACPAPQLGSITQTRQVTYLKGVAISYGAWSTVSDTCTMPTCSNGAPNYPTCTFTCANGAPNYPTCTFTCANGAPNYPTCGCTNGATNYPACTLTCTKPPVAACEGDDRVTRDGCDNSVLSRDVGGCLTRTCANGATNWPICGCTNGATNYPTCTMTTTVTENQNRPCPPPQTGLIYQQRQVTYVNGVETSATPWVDTSNTCVEPPLGCIPSNVTQCEGLNNVTRNKCDGSIVNVDWDSAACGGGCRPTDVQQCEGDNRVTRNSCTGDVIGVELGACKQPPDTGCANGAPSNLFPSCTEHIGILCRNGPIWLVPEALGGTYKVMPWQTYYADDCSGTGGGGE